jgi:hypothetical protein
MSDFLDTVIAAFRRLIERGTMTVVSHQYDEAAFGNAAVVLAGNNVLLRLRRDRGDVLADVASPTSPDDWAPLERTLMAVGVSAAPAEGLVSPVGVAALLEEHFAALNAGLSGDRLPETRARLAEIKRFKVAEAKRRLTS